MEPQLCREARARPCDPFGLLVLGGVRRTRRLSGNEVPLKYIDIIQLPQDPFWIVRNKYDETLGSIHWITHWRKYVFAPAPGCVFEEDCLRDIAQFIEERTNVYKIARQIIRYQAHA